MGLPELAHGDVVIRRLGQQVTDVLTFVHRLLDEGVGHRLGG
jgi:hypothetical protein